MAMDTSIPRAWIRECLDGLQSPVTGLAPAEGLSGCEVWSFRYSEGGQDTRAILKIYLSTFDDYSKLGAEGTAQKNALALGELARCSIPVPSLLGSKTRGDEAAIVYRMIPKSDWHAEARTRAADILARLHRVKLTDLTEEFADLIQRSTPNRLRVFRSLQMVSTLDEKCPQWRRRHPDLSEEVERLLSEGEPDSEARTVVHGDYFTKNIIPSGSGVHVIDWDWLAMGDPMWDLGFLVGADRDLSEAEDNRVVEVYGRSCHVDCGVLTWHRRCWDASWKLRDLLRAARG